MFSYHQTWCSQAPLPKGSHGPNVYDFIAQWCTNNGRALEQWGCLGRWMDVSVCTHRLVESGIGTPWPSEQRGAGQLCGTWVYWRPWVVLCCHRPAFVRMPQRHSTAIGNPQPRGRTGQSTRDPPIHGPINKLSFQRLWFWERSMQAALPLGPTTSRGAPCILDSILAKPESVGETCRHRIAIH